MTETTTHIVWHEHNVSREEHEQLNGHRGCVIWLTGLSGSGKSTVANLLERELYSLGAHTVLLDGDNVRHGLNATPAVLTPVHGESFAQRFGLGFSAEDREENIRRIAAVAQLFTAAGVIVLTAFVSPYRRDRELARRHIESKGRSGDFIEVFVDAPLEVCEARDPKGLYKKARAGQIPGFTGVNDPYEPPEHPDLVLKTALLSSSALAAEVLAFLKARHYLQAGAADDVT